MRLAAFALASVLPLTSGCVAAAIPIAAGAAIAKRHADNERGYVPRPAVVTASEPGGPTLVPTVLAALPAPASPTGRYDPVIAQFRSYALAQSDAGTGGRKRTSAIVPQADRLKAVRSDCGALPSAIFIDLDPGRGTFDPLDPGAGDPGLATALTSLREKDVRIIWFSRLGSSFGEATKAALARAKLDPAGSDELVLMPDIAERKQSLRDATAKRVCPIAMLGDERADFDELYLYLKSPDLALGLDPMIGNGWFLASPFQQSPEGDTQ